MSARIELLIDGPRKPRATLVLAHGAGAPMDSPFMEAIAQGLAARELSVVRFEFAYMARRRREGVRAPPDRMPLLEARFRAVVASLKPAGPRFLGGKSMGSRVAVQLADELAAAGVVALGYPFHPPKQPDKLRLEPLRALQTRCLIVQGTRDALGDRSEVAGYGLPRRVKMCWLEDGDHSFVPRKSSGHTEAQHLAAAVGAMSAFMRR